MQAMAKRFEIELLQAGDRRLAHDGFCFAIAQQHQASGQLFEIVTFQSRSTHQTGELANPEQALDRIGTAQLGQVLVELRIAAIAPEGLPAHKPAQNEQ